MGSEYMYPFARYDNINIHIEHPHLPKAYAFPVDIIWSRDKHLQLKTEYVGRPSINVGYPRIIWQLDEINYFLYLIPIYHKLSK